MKVVATHMQARGGGGGGGGRRGGLVEVLTSGEKEFSYYHLGNQLATLDFESLGLVIVLMLI